MTVEGFELRGFSATSALETLAELGSAVEELAQSGVKGKIHGGVLGSEPLLFVPEAAAVRPSGEPSPSYGRLLEILEQRAPHFERQERRLADDGWWRLDQVLSLLLLESGRDDEAARPEDGEWLLIDRRGDAARAAKLCDDLRFHATHCRLAATAVPDGGDCLLVHVLADPERKPSLGALAAAGALDAVDRLAAFRSGERTVFLGGGRTPSRRALAAFCDLLAALAPAMATSPRLLAVMPRDAEAGVRIEVYPLAGLDFTDQSAWTPAPSAYAEVEILSLAASAPQLRRLKERILGARPTVGHRLELRPGPAAERLDRELERVVGRLAELEQRRAYLESLREPRPVLMRFAAYQLPALADAIRCFPTLEVRDGKVLYAFEATEDHPAGCHFLLFHPDEAVQSEPYPPWRWADLEERLGEVVAEAPNETTRFWLDPLWASDYHGAGDCLVFVPRGSVLFPSLHSWRPEEMDAYLRDLLGQWFPGERGVERVPEQALYLFDRVRRGDSAQEREEVRIQVLDRDGFVPLSEQIGWINDNLTLRHALGGVEELVARLAGEESRRRLAADFASRARESIAAFDAAARGANEKVAAGATELLAVMTEEIASIAERCRAASEEIPRMHKLLESTAAALETLESSTGKTGDAVAATVRAVGENLHWVRSLDEELVRLAAERERLAARVEEEIRELERRHAELLKRLG